MGTIYIVDIPENFRIDLDSFAKMKNVLCSIRENLEPNSDGCGEYDGSDFFDDEGEYISRAREKAYNKGFISKVVSDSLNDAVSNLREGKITISEDSEWNDEYNNMYYPLSELFKKKEFIILEAQQEGDGIIVPLSKKDKSNILKRSKDWKHGIKK